MDYLYKACDPTILNLSVNKKGTFRIVGLQAQIIYIHHFRVCNLYVYFFVNSKVLLIIVCFLFDWV